MPILLTEASWEAGPTTFLIWLASQVLYLCKKLYKSTC